jgi:hypothetical protein
MWGTQQHSILTATNGVQPGEKQRLRDFMDLTGLKPSRARPWGHWAPFFPPGFDHTLVWRDRSGQLVITTEPYVPKDVDATSWHEKCLASEVTKHGYRILPLPVGFGTWNPPHTRLLLVAPPKSSADLRKLAKLLLDTLDKVTA